MGSHGPSGQTPFPIDRRTSRDDSLEKYGKYLVNSALSRAARELKGKTRICHCRPDERCHGDLLLDLVRDQSGEMGDFEDGLPAQVACDRDQWLDEGAAEELRDTDAPSSEGWRGQGLARRAVTMGRERPFHDGGGLCSPGRWPKELR